MKKFDLAIIGSGPGGYVAAIRSAQLGAKVCVIERDKLGGTCLNVGCIPTKTILSTVELFNKIKRLDQMGIDSQGNFSINLQKLAKRKETVINTLQKGIQSLFKSYGITLLHGHGCIDKQKNITIEKDDTIYDTITAERIIIASGSIPGSLPNISIDEIDILSSEGALDTIENISKSILIIGGGVIGCELAYIYNGLGSEVTIVEIMERILPSEDRDISKLLEREFKKRKIKVLTNNEVTKSTKNNRKVNVLLKNGKTISVDKILVSIGRIRNTEKIGLQNIGVKTGKFKEIIVNNKMETSAKNVYAIGDVAGSPMLAHVAYKEAICASENAFGAGATMDYSAVPVGIFTIPEIGRVGLDEDEAKRMGFEIKTGSFSMRALGRAQAMGEIEGEVKVVSDAKNDKILGVHIIGPHATDIIHEAALAVRYGITSKELGTMIHAHPTFSEALMEAAQSISGNAIHMHKKNRGLS